jgi:ATP-dependent Clp protease ATP-binding subunit ClpC
MCFSRLWRKFVGTPSAPKKCKEYISTSRAERVVELAIIEAARSCRPIPNITDLTNALLRFDEGVAAAVLRRLRVDLGALREATSPQPDPTPHDELLPIADQERKRLGHAYLGTEHLLLALLVHRQNALARNLVEQGIDIETLRQEILKQLDPNFSPEP